MHYNLANKQVHFDLDAAWNANNNGYNYNGYYQDDMTLRVPTGWKISITLTNLDANAPHSIVLTEVFATDDIPDELTGEFAIIKRAYTDSLFANESDTIHFQAKKGHYWLFCGVKRHGIDGMWLPLNIEANLQTPVIDFK